MRLDSEPLTSRIAMQGRIYFETDWDFAVKFKGKVYSAHEFDFYINSLKEFDSIEFIGRHGSGEPKYYCNYLDIQDAMEAIKENPAEHFSNLGGNRGVMWAPNDLNDEEKILSHFKNVYNECKIQDKKLLIQEIAQAMGFTVDIAEPYVIIKG